MNRHEIGSIFFNQIEQRVEDPFNSVSKRAIQHSTQDIYLYAIYGFIDS